MDYMDDISDEEFIPFLHTLGVETYKKSFDWMLNDTDFSGVLKWIYNNLDHNNALTTREECRYVELEKKERLLPSEDVETRVLTILEEFNGLTLPGDLEALEDVKLDMKHHQEKLAMLQTQEEIFKDMIAQKKSIKEDLTLDLVRLHAVQKQCFQDVQLASDHCTQLAEEVENIADSVVNVISDVLGVYGSCMNDKELSKQFFTFGPLESYRQSQALFKSHFDLYTNKKFNSQETIESEDDLRTALIEAKNMEEFLSDAIFAYIESEAELSGEQAKMLLVSNYQDVHPSQIMVSTMEAQSAIELLEQEESIVVQQLQDMVKQYTQEQTRLTVETIEMSAYKKREQIYKDLTFLRDVTQQALSLDRLVYYALRRELCTIEEVMHFAAHLRFYVIQESEEASSRIKSMSNICTEQENAERNLQTSNVLVQSLFSILGVNETDVSLFIRMYNALRNKVPELKDNINDGYKRKEDDLLENKTSMKPLITYIYDGCTRQPNCHNTTLSAMKHRLMQEREAVDNRVVETSMLFNDIKKSDKNNLRKLWQWFLTDQSKLFAAMKSVKI